MVIFIILIHPTEPRFCFVLLDSTHFYASRSSFRKISVPHMTWRCMVEVDMVRRTMALKFHRSRHTPIFPDVPYRSLPPPLFPLCSQSLDPGTAAAFTADDHHDIRARCGAEARPEEVNTLSHPHPSVQVDTTCGRWD